MYAQSSNEVCVTSTNISKIEDNMATKALHIDLILEVIASFLSITELKLFRLVCQLWNQTSLQTFRKKVAPIKFNDFSFLCRNGLCYTQLDSKQSKHYFLECMRNFSGRELNLQMVEHYKAVNNLICRNRFKFSCTKFAVCTRVADFNPAAFQDFLQTISSFVTDLELTFQSYAYSMEVGDLQFASLKTLRLRSDFFPRTAQPEILLFFKNILKNAPVLNALHFNSYIRTSLIENVITALSSSPRVRHLSSLVLELDIDDDLLLVLKIAGFRLRRLKIDNRNWLANPNAFKDFLESQSDSLEELDIYSIHPAPNLIFPRMKKLKSLEIHLNNATFPEFSVATLFPSLNCLKIYGKVTLNTLEQIFDREAKPLESLLTLVIPVALDNYDILNEAVKMFPKMKRLEVFGPEMSSFVGGLGNVEELTVNLQAKPNKLFTLLLTGYYKKQLTKIRKLWIEQEQLITSKSKEPHPIFQKLKVLKIRNGAIDDITCLLGPEKMESLQCLDLRHILYSKISEQVVTSLRKKFTVLIDEKKIRRNAAKHIQ